MITIVSNLFKLKKNSLYDSIDDSIHREKREAFSPSRVGGTPISFLFFIVSSGRVPV